MRDANRFVLSLMAAAASLATAACNKPADDANNVTITDINNADPNDIEAVPPDESSATPSIELVNGADDADVDSGNAAKNSD